MMNRIKVLFIFWTENEQPTVGLVKFHLFLVKVLFIFWTENERPTVGLVKFHLFLVRRLSSNFLVSL
jgi:hypothetical protein